MARVDFTTTSLTSASEVAVRVAVTTVCRGQPAPSLVASAADGFVNGTGKRAARASGNRANALDGCDCS